jgi:hypothetical protein
MITYEEIYFETDKSKEIEERINDLIKNKKYIEAILWFAAIFEAEATILLSLNEKIIKGLVERNTNIINNFQARKADDIRKESKTLGSLKKELEKFYDKNHPLIKALNDFIYLRNFIFHKIFETKVGVKWIEKNIIKKSLRDCYRLRNLLLEELNKSMKANLKIIEKYQ